MGVVTQEDTDGWGGVVRAPNQCPVGVSGKLPLPLYADVRLYIPMTHHTEVGDDEYRSKYLHLRRTWEGGFASPPEWGAGYTFAIAHTVTNSDTHSAEVGEGCEEYLVMFDQLTE